MLRIFLLSLWISAFCLYPHTSYSKAEVVFLKGNAVVIDPKGTKTLLRQGHVFESDGLIATDKKSHAFEVDDGSVLSLGPESKMTLAQVLPGKPKVIELLAGKLRATINEKPLCLPKGTRCTSKRERQHLGCEEQILVVHNPKNHVTSTVTFKGDVNLLKNAMRMCTNLCGKS